MNKDSQLIFEAYHNTRVVQMIIRAVSEHLGDVVEDPESEQAAEECWTLAIDAAHEFGLDGEDAIDAAKAACKELGYPRGDDLLDKMTEDQQDIPTEGDKIIVMSVPSDKEFPWVVYNKSQRKTIKKFKTYEAARNYLKSEFGVLGNE